MAQFPTSTIRVIAVEPSGDTQVRVTLEMMVDVHRMAEVGGNMLKAAMNQVKDEQSAKKKRA
jgi:hypothetical protein